MEQETKYTLETAIVKAKADIAKAINEAGAEYSLPFPVLVMVVNEIVLQSKVNALETSAAVFDNVESESDAQ